MLKPPVVADTFISSTGKVVCLDNNKKAMARINDKGMIEIPKYSYAQRRHVKDKIRPEEVTLMNGELLFTDTMEKDGIKYAISAKQAFKFLL